MKLNKCYLCKNVRMCLKHNPMHAGYSLEQLTSDKNHVPTCGNFKNKFRKKRGKTWKR